MTPAEMIARMHDIHLPETSVVTEVADGWAVGPIAAAAGAVVLLLLARVRRRRTWRRQARAELVAIRRLARAGDTGRALRRLSVLTRRIVMRDESRAAPLTGEPWLRRLDARFDTDRFTAGEGRALASAPYQPNPQMADATLEELLRIIDAGLDRRRRR
jgi:hypothetical protein